MSNDDLYRILGVSPTATAEEIKERFHFLSHAFHPDKFPEAGRAKAEREFKKVLEAYKILSDPAARLRYDAIRNEPPSSPPQDSAPKSPPPPKRFDRSKRRLNVSAFLWALMFALGLIGAKMLSNHLELEASKKRITPAEIEFVDLRLKPSDGVFNHYQLLGRARNNSQRFTLDFVLLGLTLRNRGTNKMCKLGDFEFHCTVRPGQTGEFRAYNYSQSFCGSGYDHFEYVIKEIRASER